MNRVLASFIIAAAVFAGCESSMNDLTAANALGVQGPITEAQAQAIASRHLSGTAGADRQETEEGEAVFEVVVDTKEGVKEVAVRISDGAVVDVEGRDEGNERAEAAEYNESDEGNEGMENEEENGEAINPPEVVTTALAAAFPSAANVRWSMEDGGFEASFMLEGAETSVVFATDGAEGAIETKIDMAELPEAVREAATREAAGAPITEVARIVENGKTRYEAEVTRDGASTDYIFEAAGSLVEQTAAEAD